MRSSPTPLVIWLLVSAATAVAADLPSQTPPPGPHFPLTATEHVDAPSFEQGQPTIGTSYFYWYDVYSGQHFTDADGTDALTRHPSRQHLADYSFRSANWHYVQLRDVRRAGIDFIMPVYWGVPGQYDAWSFAGLPPLVEAHDRMLDESRRSEAIAADRAQTNLPGSDAPTPPPPAIGLFYDTSTLQYSGRPGGGQHGPVDLTTPFGRDWFYTTIRDFFSLIPPAKWARIDGRPIIFLYSPTFASAIDEKLFDDTRQRFQADFGTDCYLVKHRGWPGRADATYVWGGALGLLIGEHVAALGPGYDHSAVPRREPLVVDRENGAFYARQWEMLLRMRPERRPWIVHVETWNEWHEGTDIASSAESGDQYIEATAQYAELFHEGRRLPPSGPFAAADTVRWTTRRPEGVTLRPPNGDGCWERREVAGVHAVVTRPCDDPARARYLYFDVDDSYLFDEVGRAVEVSVTFFHDGGCAAFRIAYDNTDPQQGAVNGAFRPSESVRVEASGVWATAQFILPDVRFANRANRCDFRIAVLGPPGELTVREVTVRRLPGRLMDVTTATRPE